MRWPWQKKSVTTQQADAGTIYGVSAWSDWNTDAAIKEGYKASVAAYACIKRRAESVASVPFVVQKRTSEGWEAVPAHPLQQLIDKPNPEIGASEFWQAVIIHLDLSGNAYLAKIRDGVGQVRELWPHNPQLVEVVRGATSLAALYRVGTARKPIQPEDMCHIRYPNPSDLLFGQSPLQAAGKAVDVDNAAQSYQKIGMQHRGIPDLHVSFDAQLSPEQYQQAKDRVAEQTGPGNARRPLITSKATINQLSMTPAEMDFIETRKACREDICAAYGVPSSLIAGMSDSNLANSNTARKTFWLDTVIPLLDLLTEGLTRCLATAEYGDNIRITYDVSAVPALQEAADQKYASAKALWSIGVPLNTINKVLDLGLDELPGGDVGYIPAGVVPTTFDTNMTDEQLRGLVNGVSNRQQPAE